MQRISAHATRYSVFNVKAIKRERVANITAHLYVEHEGGYSFNTAANLPLQLGSRDTARRKDLRVVYGEETSAPTPSRGK